ncbi:hypothetical protein Tco_0490949 [Tanacetum coccineum]
MGADTPYRVIDQNNGLESVSIRRIQENIEQILNGFVNPPNEIDINNLEPNDELVDTPLVPPFLDSDDDSDDGEVLNELEEYGNAWKLCRKKDNSLHFIKTIVGIKRLLDDLRVTADKLMLLVFKLLLSVFRVNAAITKLQLLKRLRLLEDFLLLEKGFSEKR